MQYRYCLQFADLSFTICSPAPLQLPEYFLPFAAEEPAQPPDVTIQLVPGTGSVLHPQEQLAKEVYRTREGLCQRYLWKENQYIIRTEPAGREQPCRLEIPEPFFAEFCRSGNWLASIALERLLLTQDRFFLHASAVLWQGKAYLFSAPSGGGKSTQADLWQQEGARILNGDKVVLAKRNGQWMAYGSPLAGSSRIYRKEGAPVAAVMMVHKAPHNRLTPMPLRGAFLNLYSNAVKSSWDRDFNCRLLDLIEEFTKQTPVFRLDCTPTREAVDCVRSILKG